MGPARPILDAPEHEYSQLLKAALLSPEASETEDELDQAAAEIVGAPPGELVESSGGRLVRRTFGGHST